MTKLYRSDHRHILKRILVRGTLVLDTPTCLGKGDTDSPTDLSLLRDSLDEKYALLTGSSIAGALRNYLRERNKGYGESDIRNDTATKLFGDLFSYKDEQDIADEMEKIKLRKQDTQSPLIIDDAISTKSIKAELRDGVKINSATRTADDGAKYDFELLQAGTEFPLSFELLIEKEYKETTLIKVIATEMQLVETSIFATFFFKWLAYLYKNKFTLLKALAIALQGLEAKKDPNNSECDNGSNSGEISLGMRKRRGFGRCHVEEWQVWKFDLTDTDDRTSWLLFDRECTDKLPLITSKIADALGVVVEGEDRRDRFLIYATFKLVGSLLIRSGQDSPRRAPDVVHLKSHRNNELKSVLSGTSLAGVLRHRAERIINTIEKPTSIIDEIFGLDFNKDKNKQAKASRLVVHETEIKDATDLVQNRIAIDRFTGGAYHGALFDEQPIFGGDKTIVTIELELRKPYKHEIGLLLLLLKDLWTQDLPVGGESSIGRGRLQGRSAILTWYQWDKEKKVQQKDTWTIKQCCEKKPLVVSDPNRLENFVQKLVNYPTEEVKFNE